jgi:peroxisomal membrane protein 2
MALSRPIYEFLGFYFEQLFKNPIRTKAVTSCVIATSANFTSQKLSGCKSIDQDSLVAYGLYGLFFGGTLPHYFYTMIERVIPQDIKFRKLIQFLLERFTFTPFSQVISLYFLSRFEGKDHKTALKGLVKLYWPVLTANWQYLSLLMFINFMFVPPMLRVLTTNVIGFVWIIFVGNKRRREAAKAAAKSAAEL